MAADGTLTERQRREIITEVEELIAADRNLSLTKVARVIGTSRATLSRILRGNYSGRRDPYLRRLRQWLDGRRDHVEVPDAAYVATSIGEEILTACELAIDLPCIGIVQTPSGWGKTVALAEMTRRLGPHQCAYIQAGEACATPRELLAELARRLGLTLPARYTSARIYRDVRVNLAGRYQGGRAPSFLIIVDEATTLRPSAINTLRNLHDDPACRPAIVLADTVGRLNGFLHARNREGIAGGNEQLVSRAKAKALRSPADEIPPADVKRVADSCLKGLGQRGRVNASSYQYLCKLAARPGALRNVTSRIETLFYYAARKGVGADYTVSQLDAMSGLAGERPEMRNNPAPFKKAKVA